MKWNELVKVNKRFENSVNIRLDLTDAQKIEQYIPTTSSVAILSHYLYNVKENKENTTMLIGPYGKGKSHLLLVLLQLLWQQKKEPQKKQVTDLIARVKKLDAAVASQIKEQVTKAKPYLPVVVTYGNENLNASYLFALERALKLVGLEELAPESAYQKALDVVQRWREEYPETYHTFVEKLENKDWCIDQLEVALNQKDESAYQCFVSLYPELTAGSQFQPRIDMDAVSCYEEIDKKLREEYGYAGLFILFDEFSKYIEMQDKMENQLSGNMGLIQSMSELTYKKENQMHQIFIAHKPIREYGTYLNPKTINAFTGVEGRIPEILFSSNQKNNYELISQTFSLNKKGKAYVEDLDCTLQNKNYELLCFYSVFEQEEFETLLVKECCPLYPSTAYFLLRISERIGQNERSLFTFLAKNEPFSFVKQLKKNVDTGLVTPDAVYDYFTGFFQKETMIAHINEEYKKAQYVIEQVEETQLSASIIQIVKTMALILMLHLPEEMRADSKMLQLASGVELEPFQRAIHWLEAHDYIVYRNRAKQYQFKNQIGVDIYKELNRIKSGIGTIHLEKELPAIVGYRYELPKRYNFQYSMTRYFDYIYMNVNAFLKLNQDIAQKIIHQTQADGTIFALFNEDELALDTEMQEIILQKVQELMLPSIVVLVPKGSLELKAVVKDYLSAVKLETEVADRKDIEERLLLEECKQMKEDYRFVVAEQVAHYYVPYYGNCLIYHTSNWKHSIHVPSDAIWNQFLSEVCQKQYSNTPVIRHEMVNRQKVSSPIRKARNKIVEALLTHRDLGEMGKGTSAEATIFRATLTHTGVYSSGTRNLIDSKTKLILNKIDEFLESCEEKKVSMNVLYQTLQGDGFGVRRGVIPIYLAQRIQRLSTMPIVYEGEREFILDANLINRMNESPEKFALLVEKHSAEKDRYFGAICELWELDSETSSLNSFKDKFVEWFYSLPQVTLRKQYKETSITRLCHYMRSGELNPREFIYETVPQIFETTDYKELVSCLKHVKQTLDGNFSNLIKEVSCITKEAFGGTKTDNLNALITDWYHFLNEDVFKRVQDTFVNTFIHSVEEIVTRKEELRSEYVIVNRFAKVLVDLRVEDWQAGSLNYYKEQLEKAIDAFTVNEQSDVQECLDGKKELQFVDEAGKEVHKYYSDVVEGPAEALQNEIVSIMEDYGEGVEPEEKVAVLMKVIEGVLGG